MFRITDGGSPEPIVAGVAQVPVRRKSLVLDDGHIRALLEGQVCHRPRGGGEDQAFGKPWRGQVVRGIAVITQRREVQGHQIAV